MMRFQSAPSGVVMLVILACCPIAPLDAASDQQASRAKVAPWGAEGLSRRLLLAAPTVGLAVEWQTSGLGREVVLLHRERSTQDEEFEERAHVLTTSFEVRRVAGMQMGHLLVEGRGRNGDQVLEWWHLTWPEGTPVIGRPGAPSGVGTPLPRVPAKVHVQGGGPLLPFAARTAAPHAVRHELYRGAPLGDWMFYAIDPEGRFVLALAKNGPVAAHPGSDARLLRWVAGEADLPEGPEVLLDSADVPQLEAATGITAWDHLHLGRVYSIGLMSFAPERKLLLVDSDNDGNFDRELLLTPAEAEALEIPAAYTDDFLRGP
jgi:hypothetical protein